MMNRLIESVFLSVFDNDALGQRHDSSVLKIGDIRIAFTTDSYVVQPSFFRAEISDHWRCMEPSTIWP
jgi:hydrogenase expression/formation protein HypE